MHFVRRLGMLLLFKFVLALSLCAQTTPGPKVVALVGGTLIDGYGGRPFARSVVLIEGERIKAIGTTETLKVPAGAEIISTEGMSVLPGLWDMHVHTMIVGHADYDHWDKTYQPKFESIIMPAAAKQLLMAGVTSARDLGAPLDPILHVRDAINAGTIPGPTLYVSGPFIQHAPYPGTELYRWGVNGPDDARGKVRRLVEAGVDEIKLIDQDQMTMDEVFAVVEEAHKNKRTVVAHAHRPEEIRRGLRAGVDCFEHTGLATAPEYPPDVIAMLRERTASMSQGPLFWTPTAEGLLNYESMRDGSSALGANNWLNDPSWQLGLPAEIVDDIKGSLRHPDRLPYFTITPYRVPTMARKFAQLRESGVMLLIGTDSGIPMNFHSNSTWHELQAWVNVFGVAPMDAIRAATYWPAVLMKVEKDSGTVAEGKYADIIAVKGDVLRQIDLLHEPAVIIKHGKRYK
jgi:imidazolonepropionase-like amidohydrolase